MKIMKIFTKLSVGAATTLVFASLFAGSVFAQTNIQGHATWTNQADAKCYQIYYKEKIAPNWQFAVHCSDLKSPRSQYTINYLKSEVTYTYRVKEISNVDNGYKYRWITNEAILPTTQVTSQW